MIRALLLTDVRAPFQAQRSAAQVAAGLGDGFSAALYSIGPGGNSRGIGDAVFRLRRAAREASLLHAWGDRALIVAALLGGRILYTPHPSPRRRSTSWLRAIMAHRNVQALCPSATLHRLLVENGIEAQRAHLLRPGVDFSRVRRRRAPALRAALGLGEEDRVLLLPGETTRAAGHYESTWAVSIAHTLDNRYRALVWGRGEQLNSIAHLARKLRQPKLLTFAQQRLGREMEFEELFGAADMALITPSAPAATLPVQICMAAALPIVATATPTVSELLEDRHTALMTRPGVPRLIARRILDLEADRSLQWSLGDAARAEAYKFYSLTRFLDQHRRAYRLAAADKTVDLNGDA
jgi:glycosyltransferase involved in cell wall biosynthesis